MGAASSSQAMAPRNGGVTNEAITSMRTARRSGMSVRATIQPIGAATTQQIDADRDGDDEGRQQRLDEGGIGEEGAEIGERDVARAIGEGEHHEPADRQHDQQAQAGGEQRHHGAGQVDARSPRRRRRGPWKGLDRQARLRTCRLG